MSLQAGLAAIGGWSVVLHVHAKDLDEALMSVVDGLDVIQIHVLRIEENNGRE